MLCVLLLWLCCSVQLCCYQVTYTGQYGTWYDGVVVWYGMLRPCLLICHVCTIDQFQNLECIAGRILGYFSQSPTFFVREIFDGIAPSAGGEDIHAC